MAGELPGQEPLRMQSVADIEFLEVNTDHPKAVRIPILFEAERNPDILRQKLEQELRIGRWWLQKHWQEQGAPSEQLTVIAGDLNIEVFNFSTPITPQEIESFKQAGSIIAAVKGRQFDQMTFLLDGTQDVNNYTGEKANAHNRGNYIQVYPHARREEPYRVPGVGNLLGVLIHEAGHSLNSPSFEKEWEKLFEWEEVDITLPTGLKQVVVQRDPSRSISNYGAFDSGEDICESFVAAIFAPEKLDPEKLEVIRARFGSSLVNLDSTNVQAQLKRGAAISLPKVPDQFYYYIVDQVGLISPIRTL